LKIGISDLFEICDLKFVIYFLRSKKLLRTMNPCFHYDFIPKGFNQAA